MEDERNIDAIVLRALVSNVARWVSLSGARRAGPVIAAMNAASSRTKRDGEDSEGDVMPRTRRE